MNHDFTPASFGNRADNEIARSGGAHRVRALTDTIDEVLALTDVLGITRIGNTTHLDVLGIPNYSIIAPTGNYPPTDGIISVFSGKGTTDERALASALMETVERYSCLTPRLPLITGSTATISRTHRVAPSGAFLAPGAHLIDDDEVLEWVPALDLVSGNTALVPAFMVFTPYKPAAGNVPRKPSSSNGVASGNTLEEATLHGTLELLERDAEALALNGGRSITLDLDTVDDPEAKDLIERFRDAQITLQIRDISQDIDVTTFLAIAIDPALPSTNFVNGGKGSHLDPQIALTRAICEVAQSRVIEMAGVREDMSSRVSIVEADFTTFIEQNASWYVDTEETVAWSMYESRTGPNVMDDLELVVAEITEVGIEAVFMVDLTRADTGIPVVRMLAPGLDHHRDGVPKGARALALSGETGT